MTDKSSLFHCYLERYEPFFAPLRDKSIKLLEIGVCGGNSLRCWLQYFESRDTEIHGVDIDGSALSHADLQRDRRCRLLCADASTVEFWLGYRVPTYNVVIDDGAHSVYSVRQAFELGWPVLERSGLWVIEDIHAGFLPEYRRDNFRIGDSASFTTLDFINVLIRRMMEWGAGQCGKPQTDCDIAEITLSKSLAIIRKRP